MSLSNWSENALLDWLLDMGNASGPTRPTETWVALHTGDPGEDGSQNLVDTGIDANYLRKEVDFGSASSGSTVSIAEVTWVVAASSPGYTVTHISIWDFVSAGKCLFHGPLVVARTLAANGILTFNAGDIVAALD